jgi:transcriptional regulator with XRE-family HTH domain
MSVGKRLILLREKKKLKQNEAAKVLGISNVVLNRYENDERTPDKDMLKTLANFYNSTTDYILGRTDTQDPTSFYENELNYKNNNDAIFMTKEALTDDPELASFWNEMLRRDDLQIMLKQVKDLSPEAIRRIIKYIKMVEDEESQES